MSRIIATIEPFLTDFCEDFIVSDTLPGTTHPDQHTITLYAKGLTCEADTLGSCGYVYLAVYPTPAAPAITV